MKRRVLIVLAAAFVCLGSSAAPAEARIFQIHPADESETPTFDFTDDQALFAIGTTDFLGGQVCIVDDLTEDPGNGSLSCDELAWGSPNQVIGLGTFIIPIESPTLKIGRYKLLGDGGRLPGQDALSLPFTIHPCRVCNPRIGILAIAAYKETARKMVKPIGDGCKYFNYMDTVGDVASGLRAGANLAGDVVLSLPRFAVDGVPLVGVPTGGALGFSAVAINNAVFDIPTNRLEAYLLLLRVVTCRTEDMYRDITADPPDSNFGNVAQPAFGHLPSTVNPLVNELATSMDRQRALARAQLTAFERYQGAVAAGDDAGVERQSQAVGDFGFALRDEMRKSADLVRAWSVELAANPGIADAVIEADATGPIAAVEQRIKASGFSPEEITQLQSAGLTDEEIAFLEAEYKKNDVTTAPVGITIVALLDSMADELDEQSLGIERFAREGLAVAARLAEANAPPVARDDSLTTTRNAAGTVNVLANDSDTDGDTLTVTGSANGPHGLVTCTFNGLCTYIPATDYMGPDSFTYTISDGKGGTATGTVNVTVTETAQPNRLPVAVDDELGTAANTAGSIDVLLNDTDPDGDTLRIAAITGAAHGSVNCAPTGLCTYTPVTGFSGNDSFGYTASDGRGGTDAATVSVTVTARPNLAPVAADDDVRTNEDEPVSFNPLANDTDADGDALALTSVTGAVHGALSCSGAGACTFTPQPNFNGTDVVDYGVSDGHGGTATAQISIVVAPVNDAPKAVADVLTAVGDATASLNVLTNDSDVDGDALSVTAFTQPVHGSVACTTAGICTYTRATGYVGADSFGYTASDGHGGTDTATVGVTVQGGPPDARADATPDGGFAPLGVTFDGSASTDPDNDIVSYSWTFGDGASATGELVTHTYERPGTYSTVLTVTDGGGRSDTVSLQVRVQDVEILSLPICGDQDTPPAQFNCPDYEPLREVQMYQVPGSGAVDVRFDWAFREAAFNNELAVFEVDDAAGSIGALRPGDSGYAAAAFARADVVFPSRSNAFTPDRTLTFEGGDIVVVFIVQNNTLEQLRLRNPNNERNKFPLAFFSIDALNPDGADHQFGYRHKVDGSIQFGFEDLAGGFGDFNDVVFNVYASLRPLPPLVVTKAADARTSDPGTANGYTITVSNTGGGTAILDSISDTLPTGFSYSPGTTTGATSTNPSVSGPTITWPGPFTVPTGESVSIHFGVSVATQPGEYLNEATADARGFELLPTGPTAKVTVGEPPNRAPVAQDGSVTLDEDTSGDVRLVAHDPDGDALTYEIMAGPSHGTLTGSGATRTYTPAPNYHGADAFTFRVSDGTLSSNAATVSITVRPVNDSPFWEAPTPANGADFTVDAGSPLTFDLGAADADSADTIAVSGMLLPLGSSLTSVPGNPAGATFSWTPLAGQAGEHTLTFVASDDGSPPLSAPTRSVVVHVRPPAQLLVIDSDSIGKGMPPNSFSEKAVNDGLATIGLRTPLPAFSGANVGKTLTLYTGQVGDEGWFAVKTIPASWDAAGPTADGLRNYVMAGPGLGTRDAHGDREKLLDKVPDVTPLRATGLKLLVGQKVCAVVYKSDVSINYGPLNGSLKGDNLGTIAVEVLSVTRRTDGSSSSLPKLEVRVLGADAVCGGALGMLAGAPAPLSSSKPFDVIP